MVSYLARALFWFGGAAISGDSRDRRRGGGWGELGVALVAPLIALLLQLAVSRSREYGADASGATLSGDPEALASALAKLEVGVAGHPGEAAPATSHLFIVNPLSGGALKALFSTHPATEARIRRLRAMEVA